MLNISGLHEGVVIDHIKAGGAMKIYNYLEMDKWESQIAIIKNASSNKMGIKDIIKIEGKVDVDLDMLGVFDSDITFNIIKNDEIVEKRHVRMPSEVVNIMHCDNPRCITSIEQGLPHKFILTDKNKLIYRCAYCESRFKGFK
ncbi:MAG: aspartate carbamoyltransferase regulatory subunit [Lachnospiraceae bacterium]|nr:aspartate carbamoyltransferase regulatory subunit [Lachnospiraceae bacterium]